MVAGMFAGASNVNISGGSFKTINGTYNHHEHVTHQHNVNSNNVLGNTYEDVYKDHSQTNYGVRPNTRNGRNRQNTAAAGQKPDQRRNVSEPYPTAAPHRPLPSKSHTAPATQSLNFSSAFDLSAMTQVGPGTFLNIKQGDVQNMVPEAIPHFHNFFAAQFPQNPNPVHPQQAGGGAPDEEEEDSEMEFGADDQDTNEDADVDEAAARMRSQSPPVARMAQLSLGNPSFYAPQTQPQAPYFSPFTSPHTPPSVTRPTRASLHQTPPEPVFSQAQQQRPLHYPPFTPAHSNPNISRQATEAHMNHVKNTLVGAGNMNPSGESFVNAPRSYSSTVYDSTDPSAIKPISVISSSNSNSNSNSDTDSESGSGSDSGYGSFQTVGTPPGMGIEQTFYGNFTEFSHEVNTMNYGLSGVVANNVVRNVFSGRRNHHEEEEEATEESEEEEEQEPELKKKRKGPTGNQGRVPSARRK